MFFDDAVKRRDKHDDRESDYSHFRQMKREGDDEPKARDGLDDQFGFVS